LKLNLQLILKHHRAYRLYRNVTKTASGARHSSSQRETAKSAFC